MLVVTKLITVVNRVFSPTNLKASQIAEGTVILTWSDSSKIETGFEVEQKTNNSGFVKVDTVGPSITTDTLFNLTNDSTYTFRVRAISKLKFSSYTEEISVYVGYNADMILVQGGSYIMGDATYATPQHSVTLSSFYISKTEVTQGQYKAVVGTTPSNFINAGDYNPVEQVNWYDCISYCNKLSRLKGKTPCYSINGNTNPSNWKVGTIVCDYTVKGYRLPTEAEWEFAARGGTKSVGYTYSGSNTANDVSWYSTNSSNTTHAVNTKTVNELGLSDMSGNVWEWCWDWNALYNSSSQTNPSGASNGTYKVIRGGSYYENLYHCLPGYRTSYAPATGCFNLGFRLVQTP